MCLAIPPNSSRSQQYSLPPYWCPYQEASSSSAAAAGAASTSTTATTTNTNKYERYYPMAETSSSSSPYASPSSFGSVANPVGCGGGAGASSLVSNNSSSSASSSSSSSLDLLFPATPPPPSPTDAFEYGLGQIMMGLSPLIMQGGSSSSISNHITNENDNITTSLPPNLQSLMATNTTTNFNNWMMMGTNINIAATNTTTSATATTTTTTTHRRRRAPQRPGKTATQKERLFVQHNYHDLANCYDDDDDNNAAASNEDSSLSESIPEQQQQHQPFPIKLHHLLEECEALGLSHIISWQPHGRAFKIHNPTLFTTSIMSKYFPKMKKLPSLQRQFNLYGFERLTREGPDAGAYYHEAFLRYRPSLSVTNMTRRRVKGTGYKAASNPEAEPNLYSYPYMTREQQRQQRQSSTTSSRSSVSSTTTTDRCSYYSTSSEEESAYPKMNPQVVSSSSPSLSPSSTCWYNHPSLTTTTTSGGSNQQQYHHHRNSSSSFMGYLDSLSQSTATTSPQSAVAQDPSMDSFLQDDVLTSNDVDAFMAKYLNEEETMTTATTTSFSSSSSSSSRRYQDLLVPSSSATNSTWPASSNIMPLLQDDRIGCISSSTTDVDSFMDRYLALPRTTQDSILEDLLCLNEGGSNSIGSSSTGAGGSDISFSFDSF